MNAQFAPIAQPTIADGLAAPLRWQPAAAWLLGEPVES
jgi:hypothetical protein